MSGFRTGRVAFRLDAGEGIGSGHAMRCATIAAALRDLGVEPLFAVSGVESASLLESMGLPCVALGGDPRHLGRDDGEVFGRLAAREGCPAVVVDTYGIAEGFAGGLASAAPGAWSLHIDDLYTFGTGRLEAPMRWGFGGVVNYTIGVDPSKYHAVFRGADTRLMVGTEYAPVRPQFRPPESRRFGEVRRVLVTTGATNPDYALERMVRACPLEARLDIVVGSYAPFDYSALGDRSARVHRDVSDLSDLMRSCDIAVSSGGTTVLELLACGAPSVVVPIVENQRANVEGVGSEGLGITCEWNELGERVRALCGNATLRERLSKRGTVAVDGRGAERIAKELTAHTCALR